MGNDEWMNRKQAAIYLTDEARCPISARTLANMAQKSNSGNGPAFTRSGWRTVRYRKDDLDAWASSRIEHVDWIPPGKGEKS